MPFRGELLLREKKRCFKSPPLLDTVNVKKILRGNKDLIQLFTRNIYRRCFTKWASSVPASLLKPMSIFVTPDDIVLSIRVLEKSIS